MKWLIIISLLVLVHFKTINCNLKIDTITDNFAKIDEDKLRIIENSNGLLKNFTLLKLLKETNLTGGYIDLNTLKNIDGLLEDYTSRRGRLCLKNVTKCMDECK